jgi:hypothetical protein
MRCWLGYQGHQHDSLTGAGEERLKALAGAEQSLRSALNFSLPESPPLLFYRDIPDAHKVNSLVVPRDRYRILLKLASFFADSGKFRVPCGQADELGKQIILHDSPPRYRYSGHEKNGARIFKELFSEINDLLKSGGYFSEAELDLCALWIEFSGHGGQFSRGKAPRLTPQAAAEKFLSYASESAAVADRGVLLEQALFGLLLVNQVQLCVSAPPSLRGQTPPESGSDYSDRWRTQWNRLSEIIRCAVQEEGIARHRLNIHNRFYMPLIGGTGDWDVLGIAPQARAVLQRTIRELWERGEITDRRGALRRARELLSLQVSDNALEQLSRSSGGYGVYTAKFERVQQHSVVKRRTADGDYTVTRWTADPMRQFREANRLQAIRWLKSGNFPHIERWIANAPPAAPDRTAKLLELLVQGPFANMLQLEAFLATEPEDPTEIQRGHAPNMTMMSVARDDREYPIVVPFGYQGIADHVGAGALHFNTERSAVLRREFKRPNESDKAMLERFLTDVVAHIAGTHRTQFPSHLFENRYLIPGKSHGEPACYASLVVEITRGVHRIITVLFHGDRTELSKYLKYCNQKLVKAGKEGFDVFGTIELIANSSPVVS